MNDKECEVFDNLHVLEASVKEETLLSLIYISGYVQKKGSVVKENDSLFYYQKFGRYFNALIRGSLTLLQDCLVQWCIFCVIFFLQVLNAGCRKIFVDMFLLILVRYRQLLCFKKTLCYIVQYIVKKLLGVLHSM